jgi:hypothetical protein
VVGPVVHLLAILSIVGDPQFDQLNLPDELLRNIHLSAEVTAAWGVQGEVGV